MLEAARLVWFKWCSLEELILTRFPRVLNSFMREAVIRYHIETSPLICSSKSMDGFLYDNGLRHERVKYFLIYVTLKVFQFFLFMIEKYSGIDRDGLCSEEHQNKSFMLLASTHPLKLAID